MNATTAKVNMNGTALLINEQQLAEINAAIRNAIVTEEKYRDGKYVHTEIKGAYLQITATLTLENQIINPASE